MCSRASTSPASAGPTIQSVLEAFLEERRQASGEDGNAGLYRRVLFFLALCINNYGHRNLSEADRDRYEKLYHAPGGAQRLFFEIFGPEALLPELDFFESVYLDKEVHTSEWLIRKAPEVIAQLKRWLAASGWLSEETIAAAEARRRRFRSLRHRARRAARLVRAQLVAPEAYSRREQDTIPHDHHPIVRLEPGRIWIRVYRSADPEEVGPLRVPVEATRLLRVGWSLSAALTRVRGRWRLAELEEIYPAG